MTNQLLKKKLKGLWKMIFLIALMGSGFSGYAQDYFYVPNENDSLQTLLETLDPDNNWEPKYYRNGDIIVLTDPGPYIFNSTLDIFAGVTIMGDPSLAKRPEIWFYDNGFRPKEDSISLTFKNLKAVGIEPADSAATSGQSIAGAFLRFDQSGYRNYDDITIENVDVSSFQQIVQLWKNQFQSHYKSLTIKDSRFNDIKGDNAVDPRKNPVDQITIVNNTFTKEAMLDIGESVINNRDLINRVFPWIYSIITLDIIESRIFNSQ